MNLRAIIIPLFFILLSLVSVIKAEEGADLLAVDSAFADGRFEQAELLVLRILQSGATLSADARARLNLTAGYAVIMQGREPEARDYFNRALDAVPDLTLDPVQVSPKFRVVFNEVKAARPKEPPREEQVTGESGDSPRREDSTIQALRPAPRSQVMNLILPGSGHWREGKKVRGAVWFGLSAASVGVLVWRIGEMRDSRADYLAQTDAERIADSYDTYNRDYQLTWAAGIAAGLVYLGSQVDLTLMKRETSETTLRFAPTQDGVKLALSW